MLSGKVVNKFSYVSFWVICCDKYLVEDSWDFGERKRVNNPLNWENFTFSSNKLTLTLWFRYHFFHVKMHHVHKKCIPVLIFVEFAKLLHPSDFYQRFYVLNSFDDFRYVIESIAINIMILGKDDIVAEFIQRLRRMMNSSHKMLQSEWRDFSYFIELKHVLANL